MTKRTTTISNPMGPHHPANRGLPNMCRHLRTHPPDNLAGALSPGIGKAVAELALTEGASVVIASTNAEKIAAAAKELGSKPSSAVLDVTKEKDVASFFVEAFPPERLQHLETMTKKYLIPRAGMPDEVAEAYIYLMRGGYTTGQVLNVEGGALLVS